MMCVSMASRSMCSPLSRECSHTGTFHSIKKSAPPHIVDQDVQATLLTLDTRHQRLHLRRVQMIDLHGDAPPASLLHQLGRLFNRFGTVILGTLRTRGATREVHRGSSRAQFDSDAPARAARCPCDQRHFAFKHARYHPPLSRSFTPRTDAQLRLRMRMVSMASGITLCHLMLHYSID